jgi:hypothetical protein
MRYVAPDGTKYSAGEENSLTINDDSYPWKGSTTGNLTLNGGDTLVFHVDSSVEDTTAKSMGISADADGVFELVKGHVIVQEGCSLAFNGGKICIINDDPTIAGNTVLPPHTDVWIIRAKERETVTFFPGAYEGQPLVEAPHPDLPHVTRHSMPADQVVDTDISGCAELHGDLNVYMFHDGGTNAGIYVGNHGDIPLVAVPTESASRQANSELAAIATAATSILCTAAISSLTDGNRPGDGPFAGFLGGHLRQDDVDGFSYHVNLKGVACGVDHLCSPTASGHSVRLGAILGFLGGNTHFSGIASGHGKTVDQRIFSGALFATCETFGKNDRKTNVNVFAGLQHSKNEMSRVNSNGYSFSGKMNTGGQFVALEAVKILSDIDGVLVGPWALITYNRVHQKGYDEHGDAPNNAGAQTVSSITHNFLDTTLGLAVEKDWQRTDGQRDTARTFLKCGWQHRAIQDHSSASVRFNSESLGTDFYPATLGYPRRNSLAISAGLRTNINGHWDTSAALHSSFAKNNKSFSLSLALGYNF